MSDYLAILAERSVGAEPAIRPRREVIVPGPAVAALGLELEEEVPAAPPGPARRAPRQRARETTHPQTALLRAATTSTEADTARQSSSRECGERVEARPPQLLAAPDPPRPAVARHSREGPAVARPSRDPRAAPAGRTRQGVTVEAPVRAPYARVAGAGGETEQSDPPTRPAVEPRPARDTGLSPAPARPDPTEAAASAQPGEAAAASAEPVPRGARPAARPVTRPRGPGEPAAVRTSTRRGRLGELAAAPPPARAAVAQQIAAVDSGRGAEPPVRVTIGRIDVVASRPASAPAPRRRAPATSLDDYLRARWGERR
jgi:hypothetical protein